MINRILVPLDSSELSESVLPWVVTLAKGAGSEVILLQVVNEPASEIFGDEPVDWNLIQEIQESAEAVARDYIEAKTRQLESQGLTVFGHVDRGRPADLILDYAKEHDADLIAFSTHGRSGIQRMILGSVAGHILNRSEIPLLLVSPDENQSDVSAEISEILVPLDMSEHGEAVLPLVQELAKAMNLKLTLVMALPNLSQIYFGTEPVAYPINAIDIMEQSIRDYLSEVAQRVQADGIEVSWEMLQGDAGNAIVECATKMSNNLVAMSTHGRSGLGRMIMGSVTDKVIRQSGDPVLVVRPQS